MSPKSYPECWRLNRCGCWSWFITRHNQFQHVAKITESVQSEKKMLQCGKNNGEWYEVANWNCLIVINTHQFTPNWTTHIKSKNIRWEQLQSVYTETRINSLKAWLPSHSPASPNFPPCDVADMKFLSRHVTQQSTIEFVISDPAVAESLLLSVSSSRGEILVATLLPGRSLTG